METTNASPNILTEMPKRIPTNGTFELTIRCNLHCKMCLFRHDDIENKDIIDTELTAKQWINLAKQVADAGTINLLITGGEPMLRSDFCEIWEGIYKQGFIMHLYTNATMVSPKIISCLQKYPPHKIGVTIYGSCPEIYSKVCGNGNAFFQSMAGIKKLMTLPSLLEFRMTCIKDNWQDFFEVEKLIKNEFGADKTLCMTRLVTKAVRGGCADVESCRLSPEENVELIRKRREKHLKEIIGRHYEEGTVDFGRKRNSSANRLSLLGCKAGMSTYTISHKGELLGCQILGLYSVDIKQDGFLSAWNKFPYIINETKSDKKCINCKLSGLCCDCYAFRYAETGTLTELPEYICQEANVYNRVFFERSKNYEL